MSTVNEMVTTSDWLQESYILNKTLAGFNLAIC